jgi:hypothetical protein
MSARLRATCKHRQLLALALRRRRLVDLYAAPVYTHAPYYVEFLRGAMLAAGVRLWTW